jgi:hypothetical protein
MANVGHNEHHKAVILSTYGVMFFGTPHQGTDKASWGKLLTNVVSIFRQTNNGILQHLEKDSEWLEIQLDQYKPISSNIFTIFCFESYPTPLVSGGSMMVSLHPSLLKLLTSKQIVSKSSAVVPGAINAESIEIRKDHTHLVKFRNELDNDFQNVINHLKLMGNTAHERVTRNWRLWDETKGV